MILELLMSPFFLLIKLIISLFPSVQGYTGDFGAMITFINLACYFFNPLILNIALANIVAWKTAHMGWAIIEWTYKKIPGVS